MNNTTKLLLSLAVIAIATALTAQEKLPPPDGHRPPPPPLVGVLDANHDGVIDAGEIANASKALQSLDQDSDGELTPDEFHPHPPGGGPGMEGPPPHFAPPPPE